MICEEHYLRRCKECFFPQGTEHSALYSLPKLSKKIIYLDQFAISNMMKALNSKTKASKKGELDKFWFTLFEKLYFLFRSQMIICPESIFHTYESLLSPYFKPLKQLYQLLSGGVRFNDLSRIQEVQIYEHVRNWISQKKDKEISTDIHSVTNGNVNAWQEKFILSLNQNYDLDWIDGLRKSKKEIHKGFIEIFKRWQSEKNKTFNDWFEEEANGFGLLVLSEYKNYIHKKDQILKRILLGDHIDPKDTDIFHSPPSAILIRAMRNIFQEAGFEDSVIWPKIKEYLFSSSIKTVPFNKISSMFYAALARKAASGRKKVPNQGMRYDIEVISTLLPYCDALFIDNECHSYLKERPMCDEIDYGTKIFSQSCKNDFLQYLNELESKQTKEHLDKLNEVYGNSWKKTFTTLYE
jgi:hypothetical protein